MNRVEPEKIHLLSTTVVKTSIIPSDEFLAFRREPDTISVGYSQDSRIDFEKGLLQITLKILLEGIDDSEKASGLQGEYHIEFIFHVENFEEFIITAKNSEEMKIDGVIGGTLMAIAFSTARGIILERTIGTLFGSKGVILPVINPNDLISDLNIEAPRPIELPDLTMSCPQCGSIFRYQG